jgi:Spy/CpxP family protein refolding chaperone
MNKTILAVASVALIATTSFASCKGDNSDRYCDDNKKEYKGKSCGNKQDYKRFKRQSNGPTNVMFALAGLELDSKQKKEIREVMGTYSKAKKENFKKWNDYSSAKYFDKENFNAKAFIDDRTKNRDDLVKIKAEFYTNLYKVLTKEQKAQFIKLLQ